MTITIDKLHEMILSGKTILITRAIDQAQAFVKLIEKFGGNAVIFPTIEITQPNSWESCDKAIDGLHMYDGFIFSSVNGAEFFFRRVKEKKLSLAELNGKMIFVVGERTKKTVEDYGLQITLIPEQFTSLDLANKLQQEDLKGKYFLFPKGNLAKDTLPGKLRKLGATVNEVVVYQTAQPNPDNIHKVRDLLKNGRIDVITFTSPSTVKNFFNLISKKEFSTQINIAVIGPTTAQAVEEIGLDVNIQPAQSTIEALIDAIAKHFQSEIQNLKSKITK